MRLPIIFIFILLMGVSGFSWGQQKKCDSYNTYYLDKINRVEMNFYTINNKINPPKLTSSFFLTEVSEQELKNILLNSAEFKKCIVYSELFTSPYLSIEITEDVEFYLKRGGFRYLNNELFFKGQKNTYLTEELNKKGEWTEFKFPFEHKYYANEKSNPHYIKKEECLSSNKVEVLEKCFSTNLTQAKYQLEIYRKIVELTNVWNENNVYLLKNYQFYYQLCLSGDNCEELKKDKELLNQTYLKCQNLNYCKESLEYFRGIKALPSQ